MSAPRLTFLYPFLFAPSRPSFAQEASRTARRSFRTASRKSQSPATATQRYGSVNEPAVHLTPPPKAIAATAKSKDAAPKDAKPLPKPATKSRKTKDKAATDAEPVPKEEIVETSQEAAEAKEAAATVPVAGGVDKKPKKEKDKEKEKDTPSKNGNLPPSPILDATESHPSQSAPPSPLLPSQNPLETVLNMPSSETAGTASAPVYTEHVNDERTQQPWTTDPDREEFTNKQDDQHRPPHISTPPYVHHFDTYGLVKRLEEGGWTQPQAVTIMKAVRLILSENMELAREGLVSKSNVENETYLFRAACSELKTEIMTKRKAEAERSRTERAQLQHEVDILGQRVTQEGGNLKDELKGMFDDRKMTARNEQRDMERKVQELNYQITISLNSDSRSDVEGVRWIITKRAITALALCVAMILGSIKFASNVAIWQEEEKKRVAALTANGGNFGMNNNNNNNNSPRRSKSGGGENNGSNGGGDGGFAQGEMFVQQGDNPAFVSLG